MTGTTQQMVTNKSHQIRYLPFAYLCILLFCSVRANTQDYTVGIPVSDTIGVWTYGIDTTSCSYDSLRIRLHGDLIPYFTGLGFQVEVMSINGSVLSNVGDTVQIGDLFSLPAPNESGILTFYYPESNSSSGFLIEVVGTPLVEGESHYCGLFSAITLLHCHNTLEIDFYSDSICTVQPSASSIEHIRKTLIAHKLKKNYPNPSKPITTIRYDLLERSFVELKICGFMGRAIRTLFSGNEDAGYQSVTWDGKDSDGEPVSSGIYVYRINARLPESDKKFHQTRKMILLR